MTSIRFAALAAVLALPLASSAAPLYSEDFSIDPTANWTVNDSGLSDILVDFYYDYSSIGVPAAPGAADTRGLKMTANNSGGVFSGFSVSPTGQSFTGNYRVEFDLWQNYVGPLGPGGSGTTQLSTFGVGSSGTTAFWPGAAVKESVSFGVTLDGGSASDYRAYSSAAPTSYPAGNPVYQAPGGAINNSDVYYSGFTGVAAPAPQVGLYPGQTGTTDAGEIAFQWRHVVLDVAGGFASWSIDGLPIATIDLSTVTLGGSNILFGHSDSNSGSSADPNDTLLNVTLIDNVVVSEIIPEPATLGIVAMGLGLVAAASRRV